MSVVGLDVGSFSCYVAVAAGGGIDTIANEYSDRLTPAYVSLCERNRSMGMSAKNQAIPNFKNTLSCFKRFIARRFNDPQVQAEIKNHPKPYSVTQGQNGETLLQASYMGEVQNFSPEQVMAMLLTKLKETAEIGLKTKVVDVVVSVPCFYTDIERKNMIYCCQMAGLNCLKVMNDTTAVSLAYGIYKQDLPGENEKARNVVFVDVGYSSIQVAATSFNKGKLKILATTSDTNLGGRDLDRLLVNYFIQEWKTKYKLDVMSKPKAYIRLTQECEKLKKLMSANTQKIPLNIECFMEDKDVKGSMDRATFEEMAAPLLARVETLFQSILELAKLSPDDIYSVEVLGGSSRVPSIKELVTKVFNKEPSTTLNADEAVSKGCALQCAILSPTFRVRDFSITDCQPYPVTIFWQGGGMDEDSSLEVFPKFHQIPQSKMLTFYRKEPFSIEAKYTNPEQVPIIHNGLGSYMIKNVAPQANGESSKVKVKCRINSNGIFTVQSASMIEKLEETEQETMETEEAVKDAADKSQSQSMETDNDQLPDPVEQPKPEESAETKDTAENKDESAEKKAAAEKKEKKKEKKMTKSIDLPIEPQVSGFTKEVINLLVEKENSMIMQDKLEKERCDSKNGVEEYVYDMRDKLCGPLEDFCREEERENFNKLLGETEDWLYDEGEDQNKQVYLDKLAELRKFGDPICLRYRESQERPGAFEALGAALQLIRKFLDTFDANDEKYIHLDKSEVDKVRKCLIEKSEWFEKQMNGQNKMRKFENPMVLATQIRQTKQSLETTCNPIISKPKPKPKEEPPKDDKKDVKKEEATTNGETTNAAGDGAKEQPATNPPPTAEMDVD